jgi:uncharacterized protein
VDGPEEGWETWLRRLPVCRVQEIPRLQQPRGSAKADQGREQRLAALVAAYHGAAHGGMEGSGGVLAGWRRAASGGQMEVLIGGSSLIGATDGAGETVLAYPAGARGSLASISDLLSGWRRLSHWTRLAGRPDALVLEPRPDSDQPGPALEDSLLGVWREPFCWLLLARPVPPPLVDELTREVSQQLRQARARAQASQDQLINAERLEARHRELRQAESRGLWQLHLLAGAGSEIAVRRLAGLLAASSDLTRVPYVLLPLAGVGSFDQMLSHPLPESPFLASSRLLATLTCPPKEEVPGLRLALRPEFDVTPDPVSGGQDQIYLGQVLDRDRLPSGPFPIAFPSLNRHTFVCGATGAGKSQTVRALLEQLGAHSLPWLVVEPAKAEYRLMASRLTDAQVIAIRPGDPDTIPAGINPLQPEPGFPLQTHVDLVRALFLAAFDAEEPFPQVLGAALSRCYEQLGWDLTLSESRVPGRRIRYPSLADLQRAARQVVQEIGYGPEVTQNVRGFIEVRLSSLRLGTTGRFFEGGHPIDFHSLLQRRVVLEIEDVGDDRDKAFLMGSVLVRLVEHLRVAERARGVAREPGLRHVSVFEEAHRLLRRVDAGPAAHAVELFAGLLAEIRAYGEGLVVAEQIPSKLVPDVIKNTAVKIVHRLPAQDDREVVGATMNVTPTQASYLVTLRPGTAAVFTDGMDFPVLVQMPDGSHREAAGAAVWGARDLVERYSPACGPHCQACPCTLRQMRQSSRLLDQFPWLRLWAELTVLGHLLACPPPGLGPDLRRDLETMEASRLDCALGQAITRAIDSRAPALTGNTDTTAFIDHVATGLRAQIRGASPCKSLELSWVASAFRWKPLWRALLAQLKVNPESRRHPDSRSWEHAYGIRIPGDTCEEQFDYIQRLSHASRPTAEHRQQLLFGADRPSGLEHALDASGAGRGSGLEPALAGFRFTVEWVEHYLAEPESNGPS